MEIGVGVRVWRKKKLKKEMKNNTKNKKSKLRNDTQYFHNTFIINFKWQIVIS